MSTEEVGKVTVFELLSTRTEITHWTTRMVLKELAVKDNNRNRKSCRNALGALSAQGKLRRHAGSKEGDLVRYSVQQA